jgi:coenzyme F420-reducing hydrogenase delta subunit
MQPTILETVYTITDWYDGARAGIADFGGSPHYYECQWADGNYDDLYRLTPIANDILELALERDEIYLRWRAAFDAGNATEDTHPALPQESLRHKELQKILSRFLRIDAANYISATGEFEYGKNLVVWTITT